VTSLEHLGALSTASPLAAAIVASTLAGGLATAAGGLPVWFFRSLHPRASNGMLAFAAGVMLAATVFSLLLPGLTAAREQFGGPIPGVLATILALCLGGAALWAVHRHVPHEHFTKGYEGPSPERVARVWLFVLAITVHNFPEGLAVGVGAASGDATVGLGVSLGIALQNMPEGLAVAMALRGQGYTRKRAFLVAAATGLVEIVGGACGGAAIELSRSVLPFGLAFAAGAMLFVISNEVIPETHRPPNADGATAWLFVGFAIMMFLDTALAHG
jgi:ZIP family zinc transporter